MTRVLVNLLQTTGTKGGIELYVRELYSTLGTLNHEFEFVGLASKELAKNGATWFPGKLIDSGISGENRVSWALGELWGVNKFAKKLDVDLIHCPAMFGPLNPSVPVVLTIHDLSYFTHPHLMKTKLYTEPVKWMEKRAAKAARRIICISESTAEVVRKYFPSAMSKIDTVLSAGREMGLERKRPEHREHNKFLAMGQRSPYKSFETVIKAWALLPLANRPQLVITGSHGNDPLAPMIAQYGLEDSITLLGWVGEDELNSLMINSTALIEPTVAAGFGMPALEAMTIGMPVIVSDIPVFREIVSDAGIFFRPADPESLAEAIQIASQSDALLQANALKGMSRSQDFSWNETALQTLSSFRKALEDKN